jgi:hypothetical protein
MEGAHFQIQSPQYDTATTLFQEQLILKTYCRSDTTIGTALITSSRFQLILRKPPYKTRSDSTNELVIISVTGC